jgi:hypothetical protein
MYQNNHDNFIGISRLVPARTTVEKYRVTSEIQQALNLELDGEMILKIEKVFQPQLIEIRASIVNSEDIIQAQITEEQLSRLSQILPQIATDQVQLNRNNRNSRIFMIGFWIFFVIVLTIILAIVFGIFSTSLGIYNNDSIYQNPTTIEQ